MNSKSKIKNYFIPVLAIFTLLPLLTFAAELRVEIKNREISVGEQFKVDVVLNAKGEELNAIEGSILFPDNLISLKEIRDGNSIINFWIERPKITNERKIDFSGIIPGGYKEANGFLFSAIFVAKSEGQGIIEFRNFRALKNDGLGTSASLAASSFQFLVSKQVPVSQIPTSEIKDSDPPEKFGSEIASDPTLFDGKWFLVFATQDKGSGIDHYEVRENFWGGFVIAKSPYILQNQNVDKKIYVKATDKAGNERIEAFYPVHYRPWYQNYRIIAILMIVAVIVSVILKKFNGKNR